MEVRRKSSNRRQGRRKSWYRMDVTRKSWNRMREEERVGEG
jgi:hypothetical protein